MSYIPLIVVVENKNDQFYLDILGKYLLRDVYGMNTIFRAENKCTERR